jgi:predicted kinase
MADIEVLVGLPQSGKSTYARSAAQDGAAVVNPDSIRLALHGQAFLGLAEPFVWAIAQLMVRALALAGHRHIIIDATNTMQKRREMWAAYATEGHTISYHVFDTPPAVCIERARKAGREDLVSVITRMEGQWDLPRPSSWDAT